MMFQTSKKGVKFAHLNICSLKHKICELSAILLETNIHITAVTETHLNETVEDTAFVIEGYSIFRLDRNKYGGGTAFNIQNNIPVKMRKDLA